MDNGYSHASQALGNSGMIGKGHTSQDRARRGQGRTLLRGQAQHRSKKSLQAEKTPIPSLMTISTKILVDSLPLFAFRGVCWVLPVLDGLVGAKLRSVF